MSQKLRTLDLFAGIGGFSLGLERTGGFETVAFCEIEPYPQKVLAKHWPGVPIYDDVRQLTAERLATDGIRVDVITGGFPCQDISVAGSGEGIAEGTRSGLWSECARLIGELQPRFAIFENVSNLLNGNGGDWFKRVLWDISTLGYDAEWHCIPASELGAHHHRDRVWIIAYPKSLQRDGGHNNARELMEGGPIPKPRDSGGEDDVADTNGNGRQGSCIDSEGAGSQEGSVEGGCFLADPAGKRQQGSWEYEQSLFAEVLKAGKTANALPGGQPEIWKAEPSLDRVADGVPQSSHRLKALGNAVVPQIPELIGRAILESEARA